MLKIRLQRVGKKKQPSYRLVISEHTKDTQAGSLEILGRYNPIAKPKIIELKGDRIRHWLSKGAAPSNTVHNLLINAGILSGPKKKAVIISKKHQDKMDGKKAVDEEEKKAQEDKSETEVVSGDITQEAETGATETPEK